MKRRNAVLWTCLSTLMMVSCTSNQDGSEGGLPKGVEPAPPAAGAEAEALAARRASHVATVQKEAPDAYRAEPSRDGFRAANVSHGLQLAFTPEAVEVTKAGDDPGFALRFAPSRWGCEGSLVQVPRVAPEAQGNRVDYRREGLSEWYVNGPLGLEQGFTLAAPPPCRSGADRAVVIELGNSGDLHAEASADGERAWFRGGQGELLRYADLYVADAVGRRLSAKLAGGPEGLSIRVDDAGAVYPIQVDPVLSNATPTCITFRRGMSSVQDALISATKPTKNYGSSQSLTASSSGAAFEHALVKWDLSSIPSGAFVTSATATLRVLLYGGAPVHAHRVTVPWSESTVTWGSFPESMPSTPVSATFAAASGVPGNAGSTSADLAVLVKGWLGGTAPNHGILLERDAAPGNTVLASSEFPEANLRPTLEVCFVTDPCAGQADGTACDDGDACTLTDTCQNGLCTGSNTVVCTAQDVCHEVGTCNAATGQCSNPVAGPGTPCDDGDLCNGHEICLDGVCSAGGSQVDCDDGIGCTIDACIPATGMCTHDAGPCTPGCPGTDLGSTVPQTVTGSTVAAGMQLSPPLSCSPTSDAPEATYAFTAPATGTYTFSLEGSSFDTVLYVLDGACNGPELACNDDLFGIFSGITMDLTAGQTVVVVVDGYQTESGQYTLNITAGSGNPCAFVNCNDANSCTADTCDPGTGECVHTLLPDGTSCDDYDVCTTGSTCSVGFCLGGAPVDCNDGLACTVDSCDSVLGCVHDGQSCGCPAVDLGSAVPQSVTGSTTGRTDSFQPSCALADGAPDTTYRFTAPSTRLYAIDLLGSSYDTALYVLSGSCAGAEIACNDDDYSGQSGIPQSSLVVNLTVGQSVIIVVDGSSDQHGSFSLHVGYATTCATSCDDGDPCTLDACQLGGCTHTPLANNTPCDDGNACTTGEHCYAGQCSSGSAVSCDDGLACTADSCNPATGCVHDTAACGLSCDVNPVPNAMLACHAQFPNCVDNGVGVVGYTNASCATCTCDPVGQWALYCYTTGYDASTCSQCTLGSIHRSQAPCGCSNGTQTIGAWCTAGPTCNDGIQNQGEQGIDCGGPCFPCPTCSDSVQNQGEQGIDCGGPCPQPCP